jgi:hypothetical protein
MTSPNCAVDFVFESGSHPIPDTTRCFGSSLERWEQLLRECDWAGVTVVTGGGWVTVDFTCLMSFPEAA